MSKGGRRLSNFNLNSRSITHNSGDLDTNDKQALIDITNAAKRNDDPIRADIVAKLKEINPTLTIDNNSRWNDIKTNIPSVLVGDAATSNVLSGKAFMNISGKQTGTMPNNGAVTITPGATAKSIALGYHNGLGTVAAVVVPAANVLTGTTIAGTAGTMPKKSGVNVTANAPAADTAGNIILNAPAAYYDGTANLIANDPDFIAANFRADKNVLGLQGTLTVRRDNANPYPAWQSRGIAGRMLLMPEWGHYENGQEIYADDADFIAANILNTANIFGLQGSAVAGKRSATGTISAWTSGTEVKQIRGLLFQPATIKLFFKYGSQYRNDVGIYGSNLQPPAFVTVSNYGMNIVAVNANGFDLQLSSSYQSGTYYQSFSEMTWEVIE